MATRQDRYALAARRMAEIEGALDTESDRWKAAKEDHTARVGNMERERADLARQVMSGQGDLFDNEDDRAIE